MIRSYKGTIAAFVLFVIVAALVGPSACTDETSARRVLSAAGYTDIEITGWRPMMAGEHDVFSTGFRAKGPNGAAISGAVTSGAFKGSTIRFD